MNFDREQKFLKLRADWRESKWGIDTRNTAGYAPRILQEGTGGGKGEYGS